MLKCQWFEYSKSDEIEPRVWKYLYIDIDNNKKRQSFNKYKGKYNKYILFPLDTRYFPL